MKSCLDPHRRNALETFLTDHGILEGGALCTPLPEAKLLIIEAALTHPSYYAKETAVFMEHRFLCERLEFLGDSILHGLVSEYLYKTYPHLKGGALSRLRASLVSGKYLAQKARSIRLGGYLKMGAAEHHRRMYEHSAVLENAFECLLGALFWVSSRRVVKRFYLSLIKDDLQMNSLFLIKKNDKTLLQEALHKKGLKPIYRVEATLGPKHQRSYEVGVYVNEENWGIGRGTSIKGAEQDGAKNVMLRALAKDSLLKNS